MEELRGAKHSVAVGVPALEQPRVAAPLAACDHAVAIVIQLVKAELLVIPTREELIAAQHTVAAGIRVPKAVGDFLILRAVRESGGFAIAVPDEAIVAAVDDAARQDGLLLCPEGGATLAAAERARDQGLISSSDRVVLFNCATGLKYPMADRSRHLAKGEAIPNG